MEDQGTLKIFGEHDGKTIAQMWNCLGVGKATGGVLCADGHLGYAQPVGGVVAYDNQISISGVGFDIGCGNTAIRLSRSRTRIEKEIDRIMETIPKHVSFGLGRANEHETVEHPLFDDLELWKASGMNNHKDMARKQLGTVGSGNHYVDLFEDETGAVWIGVHFGSRGLGHKSATKYLKAAGGRDGMDVPPAVIDADSDLGEQYLAAMTLAGMYAKAGRDWVVQTVRKIVGGDQTFYVNNHHNYAWLEEHDGRKLWVVRKGATPAFPGQFGFVGGSMGDHAVIIEGVDSDHSKASLYSTVHGAGRVMGRNQAKKTFAREDMDEWLRRMGVRLHGGDLDESPMAYRRLDEVLDHHEGTIKVHHRLKPFAVFMAGKGLKDPYKD